MAELDTAPQKDLLTPSYTITEMPFANEQGDKFSMSYIRIAGQIGNFPDDPFIQGLVVGISPVSDVVFPETLPGRPLHHGHIRLVNGCNSIAVIRPEGSERIIGFHLFDREQLEGTSFHFVDMHAAGVHPDFQGGKVMQRSREALLKLEDPDMAYGSTIHPAIYKSYQRIAHNLRYVFFPTSVHTPSYIVDLVRKLLWQSSEASAAKLDDGFVKRNHLPVPVQGHTPYTGFAFFEKGLHVNPTDGVALLLIKPNVINWAKREFGKSLIRRAQRFLTNGRR